MLRRGVRLGSALSQCRSEEHCAALHRRAVIRRWLVLVLVLMTLVMVVMTELLLLLLLLVCAAGWRPGGGLPNGMGACVTCHLCGVRPA